MFLSCCSWILTNYCLVFLRFCRFVVVIPCVYELHITTVYFVFTSQVDTAYLFPDMEIRDIQATSLSGIKDEKSLGDKATVEIQPMEIKTYRIKFHWEKKDHQNQHLNIPNQLFVKTANPNIWFFLWWFVAGNGLLIC